MVHHIVLCKVHSDIEDEHLGMDHAETRIRLLKIPEVRAIRCGKRIEAGNEWDFFFSADYESMEKMAEGHASLVYQHFLAEVIYSYVREQAALSYEMEPGKDVRYS